ncbi:TlpA disulfide reductase family protein [Breoghania sp. L-A4]|uniref:thiol:disulfide interchange protein TlpA n=1 Tax=Breoghania sp. L-A4 TaxID=2304600 RepID=UPI000E359ADE|nr:TlpA disulfide reductase family protein [Breoghania sp. L-A4]AXS38745.1 TlpA family protein disulfide reductase [Breoghania sp. L-A4]
MTTTQTPGKRRFGLLTLAAVAGTIMGLAAIYVIGRGDGNGADVAQCAEALETAKAIAPLATGEVAAFLPAAKALSVAELTFKDGEGAQKTLGDFEGQTVLLNLWATWCAPCRKEMPALDRLQQEMGGDDFSVVAVNVDSRNPQRPREFLKEINVTNLEHYSDETMGVFNEMRKLGRATGLPSTMLIDGKGCEIGSMYGPAEWDSADALALIRAAIDR